MAKVKQNTSSAVMAQRIEPHDSLDDFPTPPWATRALCNLLEGELGCLDRSTVLEPACGRLHMARALAEYSGRVIVSDVHPYSSHIVDDFLFPKIIDQRMDWVITNPPFRLALPFIHKAREISTVGCAMLVRSQFLEGENRYSNLFQHTPPTIVAQFVERVPMFRGRCLRYVVDKKGRKHRASTATAYTWLIWKHGERPRPFHWIAPCRRQLERFGDYDDDKPGHSDRPTEAPLLGA
jgi:hypothetical protein